MMFSFENGVVLRAEDFDIADRVMLIDDFLFSSSVTLIYSPPKQGKTWLTYAIAKTLVKQERVKALYYLDMDNPLSMLKERGVDESMVMHPKIKYITKARLSNEPIDLLRKIAKEALLNAYDDIIFVLDTTKDFVDTHSTTQAKEFLGYCTRIRDAGGTLIILHHTTKNAKRISGESAFINTPDNVYELKEIGKLGSVINFSLQVTHARGLVKDVKYSVDTANIKLLPYDPIATGLNQDEIKAVELALVALKATPEGLSRRKLIEAMGFQPSDRTGIRLAEELDGKKWKSRRQNARLKLYHPIKR